MSDTPKVLEFTSPDSTTTIYACGWCKLIVPHGTPELADACCRCKRCGNRKEDNWRIYCAECDAESRSDRNADERAKALTLPILEDYVGPVYVDDETRYYEDQWEAAESLMFDHTAEEFADIIVHPCNVGPMPVPELYDIVNESWACEMDSDYDFEISKKAEDAIAACMEVLRAESPIVWNARTTERIVLTRPSDDD